MCLQSVGLQDDDTWYVCELMMILVIVQPFAKNAGGFDLAV